MSLDLRVWANLEAHGVTEQHLEMLLRLLEVQRSGSWTWHYAHGALSQCEVRLSFPARGYEVARVSDALFEGHGLIR